MNWFSCPELQERSLSDVKHICVWMVYRENMLSFVCPRNRRWRLRVDAEFDSASGLWLSVNPNVLFKI